jgi:probable phosphoglycerate mutase
MPGDPAYVPTAACAAYDQRMLHCPATLYIARHGDAEYPHAHVMSDDGGFLTDKGREQVTACARELIPARVARVYTSPLERARQSAHVAAPVLDIHTVVLDGLAEISVGDCAGKPWGDPSYQDVLARWVAGDLDARIPGAESGREVLERFRGALQEIADQHRGEQVLVFSHGGVMSFAIPRLAGNVRDDLAREGYLPNAVPARVEVGDDGWRVVTWPGSEDKAVV